MTRPLLVGEDNPYGTDSRFALYPLPEGSAGWRLCVKVMGLSRGQYLRRFDRVNLCARRWSIREARERADAIKVERRAAPEVPIVLLGAKVCDAFVVDFEPFAVAERFWPWGAHLAGGGEGLAARYVVLPHPSGRSRAWNAHGAYERAREVLCRSGALPLGSGVRWEECG